MNFKSDVESNSTYRSFAIFKSNVNALSIDSVITIVCIIFASETFLNLTWSCLINTCCFLVTASRFGTWNLTKLLTCSSSDLFAKATVFWAVEPYPFAEFEFTAFTNFRSFAFTFVFRWIDKNHFRFFVTSLCIRLLIINAFSGWCRGCPLGTFTWNTILIASWSIIFSKLLVSTKTSCLKISIEVDKIFNNENIKAI